MLQHSVDDTQLSELPSAAHHSRPYLPPMTVSLLRHLAPPPHLAAPPRGRGRCRLPVPGAGPGRTGSRQGRHLSEAGGGGGPPRRDVAQAAGREGHSGGGALARPGGLVSGPGWPAGWAAACCCRCCSRRRAARSRATSTSTGRAPDGAAGPTALRWPRNPRSTPRLWPR